MSQTARSTIKKINGQQCVDADDLLAVEEPLEIRLAYYSGKVLQQKSVSVTMRTPGNDEELAIGFLYTEGIISSISDVTNVAYCKPDNKNIICVTLVDIPGKEFVIPERNFYTTSSCGVCGKASIEAVKTVCSIEETFDRIRIPASMIYELPGKLRSTQDVFEHTGGLHACALFDTKGNLLLSREDVGRHNAVDKLIGTALRAGMVPLRDHILLLSGRISFELVQKAVMAGIKIVAAVGAPSSLAAEMAEEQGMTLIGFLRGERFNIYSGAERILM